MVTGGAFLLQKWSLVAYEVLVLVPSEYKCCLFDFCLYYLVWIGLLCMKEYRHQSISKSVLIPEAVCYLFVVIALKVLKSKEQPLGPGDWNQVLPFTTLGLMMLIVEEKGATPCHVLFSSVLFSHSKTKSQNNRIVQGRQQGPGLVMMPIGMSFLSTL